MHACTCMYMHAHARMHQIAPLERAVDSPLGAVQLLVSVQSKLWGRRGVGRGGREEEGKEEGGVRRGKGGRRGRKRKGKYEYISGVFPSYKLWVGAKRRPRLS